MRLGPQPFPLRERVPSDPSRFRVRLLEHERRFAAGVILEFVRGMLGRRQRRAEERLELAMALQVGL